MRIIKLSVMSLLVVGMTACTTVRNKYGFLKDETQSYRNEQNVETTVVIPQNLTSKSMQDYYEIPPAGQQAQDNVYPNLAPPGSNLAQKTQSQQDRIRNAESAKIKGHTSVESVGPTSVSVSFSQAWVKVGNVLQSSNYKIVEKDKALGTYFVIDTRSTGGKVKKDMPIYQVHLKAIGNGTTVSVSPRNSQLQSQLNRSLQ